MSSRRENIEKLRSKLSPEKQILLQRLLRCDKPEAFEPEVIKPRPEGVAVPLSFSQRGLWFFDQLQPGSVTYNIAVAVRLKGDLNTKALQRSIEGVINRHEALRTSFFSAEGTPFQKIVDRQPFMLPFLDLTELYQTERETVAHRLAADQAREPFDLSNGPLLRAYLMRLSGEDHLLQLTVHHIVSDGWSMGILVREAASLYQAFCSGHPSSLPGLPIQYGDFAVWQNQLFERGQLDQGLSYWTDHLKGSPPLLELPTDRPRKARRNPSGSILSLTIDDHLAGRLESLSRQEGVTLFMTLLSAFKVLLLRYTGQEDLLIGTPVANRQVAETEGLIGLFVNTLVLRTDLSGEPTFEDVLKRVRGVTLAAYSHQNVPLDKVVDQLHLERTLSWSPLIQVMFGLQNYPLPPLELGGLKLIADHINTGTAILDLSLLVEQREGFSRILLEYSTDLFELTTIDRMIHHWLTLLDSIIANRADKIHDLQMLTEAELRQILTEWNGAEITYLIQDCIHWQIEAQAESRPTAVALVFEHQQLTYDQLNRRANQLARHLQSLGAAPEKIVGLFVERSFEVIIGMLGILKAGAAYVPLDPAYPKERLAMMLKDSGVRIIVTERSLLENLPNHDSEVVCIDADWGMIVGQSGENLISGAMPENLAYVIYTSGSTGKPKGVMVQHKSLVSYIRTASARYAVEPSDRVLQFCSISFDISTEEIYSCLTRGATLVLRTEWMLESISRFLQTCYDWHISVLSLPTAYWNEIVAGLENNKLSITPSLRLIIVAGEKLIPERLATWQRHVSARPRLINTYGPTEATISVTMCELTSSDSNKALGQQLSIGRVIPGAEVYILDRHLHAAPIGVPGEILIGGSLLARGYLHEPSLTADKFIPNPHSREPGARLYRTGDLARYFSDGNIEFICRLDDQVKLRGFRVELGDVEAALIEHPTVHEVVVLAREDVAGNKRLIGYVVAERELDHDIGELRAYLRSRLPEYMVPSAFVILDEMPLTPNGKVDRRALPAAEDGSAGKVGGGRKPAGEIEQLVAGIWEEVLAVAGVRAEENFFDLGGHSLLAIRVMSRVRDAFKVEVDLKKMFERPTVAGLAEAIREAARGSKSVTGPVRRRGQALEAPLSYAQQRLWFLDKLEPGSAFYNIPLAVRVDGEFDSVALELSLNEVVRRHEALRTRYEERGGEAVQVVAESWYASLGVVDLTASSKQHRETEASRLILEEAQRGFDLPRGPVVRWKLLRMGECEHVLVLTMHHIASDGWSVGVLMREVGALYEAYSRGDESPLEELAIQYADYAVWQREWLRGEALEEQVGYWRERLKGAAGVLEMPTDRPRPAAQTYNGSVVGRRIGVHLAEELRRITHQESMTLNMVMLAGFKVLLWRYSGERVISVGTPVAGRNRVEIEALIGCFVNTLVMTTRMEEDWNFKELMREVRENVIGGQQHQDIPFEKLVEEMNVERSLSRSPLFQVMFAMQNRAQTGVELTGLRMAMIDIGSNTAKFELSLFVSEEEDGLRASVEYNTDIYDRITVERLLGHYERLLEGVTSDVSSGIAELPLLSESETRQLLVEWNSTNVEYDTGKRMTDFFEQQVERAPGVEAVVCGEQRMSYGELNRRANHLAHRLRAMGVEPEVVVGVCAHRAVEMVIALLGVLKAGAAYLPLDPAYPKERLAFMLQDAHAAILVTERKLASRLPDHRCDLIYLDADERVSSELGISNPISAARPGNLAYVIYTSGSTGMPKGVAIEHRSATAMICWSLGTFSREDLSGVLASTSICFDLSVFEIFVTLSAGGKVILAENVLQLSGLGAAGEVTLINTVPSAMAELIRQGAVPGSVRVVNLAGEPLLNSLAQSVYRAGGVESVYNLYGPSEDTTYSTWAKVEEGAERSVAIGRPVWNTRVYVLGSRMQPVPVGARGEIYISGEGLARGYFMRPELTAERFLPDPFSGVAGERMYATGDVGRYRADKEIEFLSRADHQVKVRGYRVEPGEVEAALESHPGVRNAVVLAREERGEKCLIGYIVSQDDVSTGELREYLRGKLPEYMVPSAFVTLDEMPTTPNGKVDRQALAAAPWQRRGEAGGREARTETERLIAGIWEGVLGVGRVGAEENFFDIGGHSLLATQVVSRIRNTFGLELPLRNLFESPTVAGLARNIQELMREGNQSQAPPIVAVERDQQMPLSFAQQRLWFLNQLDPTSPSYNIPLALSLSGTLNVEALAMSFNEILRRHETLRTAFHVVDGLPSQVIADELSLTLALVDLSEMPEADQGNEARLLARQEAGRPFDLSQAPLLRAAVLRLGGGEYIALVTMHHIVSDGWSMSLFIEEVAALYEAYFDGLPHRLPPLPIQYSDFAMWQRQWLQGENLDGQISYWKSQLAGAPEVLAMPVDRPRPALLSFHGASIGVDIGEALTSRLEALSRREGVTLFMTLLAAFKVLLYRYSGQSDIVVGTAIANRNRQEVEGLIGFFVNAVALRTDLSGEPTFRQLLAKVREVALGAYANQDIPFERVVDELKLERSMSHTPLFQVSFVLQNAPSAELKLKGVRLSPVEIESGVTKYDLTLRLEVRGGRIMGQIDYSTDLYERETVSRMVKHYERVLEEAVTDCEQEITAIQMMSEGEVEQLLKGWNQTEEQYAQDKCVQEMIEEQAKRTPDTIAVVYQAGQLSYRELNERANRLARYLREQGVDADGVVGVCIRRGVEMMVSVLGVLKAGGAYLPMEATTPSQRLDFMMEDAGVEVVVTEEALADKFIADKAKAICVDRERLAIANRSGEDIESPATGLNLAYVIYTSGSTGSPKGVAITHRNLANYTSFICRKIESGGNEQLSFATVSAFSADLGNTCIFPALASGGCLHILSHETIADTQQLVDYVADHRIGVLKITPSYLNAMLSSGGGSDVLPSKYLILGGEALSFGLVERVKKISDACQVINHYGPTETTVGTTVLWPVDYEKYSGLAMTVPIGRPVANSRAYILDRHYRPVPVGVAGELYICGDGLARGYLKRPELTAERFIPDAFSADAGQRLYRTGDIARYLSDGNIEFLGRNDHQVKIRGYRVEIGEVERAINEHPRVQEAVVLAQEEEGGQKRLVGYVLVDAAQKPAVEELREYLRGKLPEYMVPSAFVTLDEMPTTPNGKVDRQALAAAPWQRRGEAGGREARTETERLIAGIWEGVLGVGRVGAEENFFDIGGHSLLATQVVSRIRETFNTDVKLRSIFESPTVSGLAEVVRQSLSGSNAAMAPAIHRRPQANEAPLSFAQQRLWFLDKLEPGSAFYNIPAAIRVEGELNVWALEMSLNEVVRRHEVLRTRYEERDGVAVQVVGEFGYRSVGVIDLSDIDEQGREEEADRQMREEAERGFDLARGPVIRWKVIKVGAGEHVLALTTHHVASDGWSVGVLMREVGALYEAYSRGDESPLEELAIQYADYAVWQREWLRGEALEEQVGYWRERLKGAAGVLEMPTDRPRSAVQTYRGASVSSAIGEDLSLKLKQASRRQSVTMFMLMLAAFKSLLYRYSGQEDILIGIPIAGRNEKRIEDLIGLFINTLVIRTDFSKDHSFHGLLVKVREDVLGAYDHQGLPLEKLVDELKPGRSLSHSPLFQVTFNFLNVPMEELRLQGLSLSYLPIETQTSKFDLTMAVTELDGDLNLTLTYNSNLFDDSTVGRMLSHYRVLLEGVLTDPSQLVSELPLVAEAERTHLLVSLNETQKKYPSDRLIHQLFEDQVAWHPGRAALVFEDQRLSYGELNSRANQVAHYLKSVGVGPDVPVGVFAERSVEMVVALLATLKAGGAYVPLDPAYPKERLAFMLRDSRAPILLTQSRLVERLPELNMRVIALDDGSGSFADCGTENCENRAGGDNLAYIIYTSGSTGLPKAAMNSHASILNRLLWMQDEYELAEFDGVLQKTTFSFDVSVWEFFWPLMAGARLVLAGPGAQQDSQHLVETIVKEQITTLHFVPSMLHVFLQQPALETCGSLKRVICSGEALSLELQERFYGRLQAELYNLYGPTEAAVDVTHWHCRRDSNRPVVPIGRPIANTQIYILNHRMQPTPYGVYGELHIGGKNLARGYLGRPDLTAEKFVPNPLAASEGERLYRTGDLARFLPDGNIEFLRRIDHQVKIRGFRIEPGEIESALRSHPAIEETVVLAREDAPGGKSLVAYIVAGDNSIGGIDDLIVYLKDRLPEYMVPAAFVKLESMPLTPNGKIDRRALPAPGMGRPDLEQGFVAPRNPLEMLLAQMWQEILGIEKVGVHDDFFQLGGDSIRGAVFINRLQEKLNEIVHVVVIFNAPTIAHLADYINRNYPASVSRLCSEDVNRPDEIITLDEAKIARFRRLIKPSPAQRTHLTETRKNPSAIFVLAPFRSGSTLFRVMLGGHPRLFAPPELEMLSFNTLQERRDAYEGPNSFWLEGATRAIMEIKGCEAEQAKRLMTEFEDRGLTTQEFYRQIQERLVEKNETLVDKSPSYALDLETLRRAETYFDNALYIHLVRHPLAVVRSFEEARLDQLFFRYRDGFSTRELAALIWLVSHQHVLEFLKQVPEHRQHRLKFEDLVGKPEESIQRVCDFLGLEPHPDMLRPYKDKHKKMTDGLYAESRMLGDVKFHSHSDINAAAGGRWKDYNYVDDLGEVTWQLAESFGYERPDKEYVSRGAAVLRVSVSSHVDHNDGGPVVASDRPQVSQQSRSRQADNGNSGQSPLTPASTLVSLQPEGSDPPFFCVHPVGGNVFCYVGLARRLGNKRPFYAFRASGLDEGKTPLGTVEEMADSYIEAMRAAQPEGPYLLGGWSFGGVVAYEMARKLHARTQDVARLILIDTYAPQLYDEFDENSAVGKLGLMARFGQDLGLSLDRLSLSLDQVLRLNENEQLALVLKAAQGANVLPPGITISQARRLYSVFRNNLLAARKYEPTKFGGRITLIMSSNTAHKLGDESAMGWDRLAAGGLETHTIPGNHYSIVTGPDLQMLVDFLKKRLEED